jgi:hypothetical protein
MKIDSARKLVRRVLASFFRLAKRLFKAFDVLLWAFTDKLEVAEKPKDAALICR